MSTIQKKEEKKKYKEERRRLKEEEKAAKAAKKREAKERKRGKGKGSIIGQEIGMPTNFSHDTHVGWDLERGFEVRNIPPEWKKLFVAAGVKKSELEDPEMRALLLNTVRQSMYGAPPAPPSGAAVPAAPPPPPAPAPPPLPNMAGGRSPSPTAGRSPGAPPLPAREPSFEVGAHCIAQWSEDRQWYNAVIDSVSQEGGVKYFTVTFTEYGNSDTVTLQGLKSLDGPAGPGAPPPPPGGADLAALLQAKAQNLKTPDITNISAVEEGNLVASIQTALSTRRAGMCFSVYGHDAVGDEEWSDDESWMDF